MRIETRFRRVVAFAVCMPLAAVQYGCGQSGTTFIPPPATTATQSVQVINPEYSSLRRMVEQPGAIEAHEQTHIFARVSGYVSKVSVDIGQKVEGPKFDSSGKEKTTGQILAEISVPELQEEANQKVAMTQQVEAEIEQSQKALAASEATIATMDASVVEAKAMFERWESEYKRIVVQVEKGTLDVQARDETQNQFKAAGARVQFAQAAVRKAQADRDKAQADVRAAQSRLAVAQADARGKQAMLAYAKIRAPYDGVVTARKVNTGDFVHPGIGQGDWLFTIAKLDPVRIVVAVPEADAALVNDKAEVNLTIKAAQTAIVKASITRISWALDPGSRTLRAEIELPNKDGALRPGMYVYAQIRSELPKCWTLPVSAVVKQGDTMVCFFVDGGKAVRTPVQVGRNDGQFMEVLKWQKAGSTPTWVDFSDKEAIVSRAAGLTDGQSLQLAAPSK